MMVARNTWQSVARRIWLWPVAILVGFPVGGYIADLAVNGVDSIGTALVGGLIAGAVSGCVFGNLILDHLEGFRTSKS